MHPRLSLAIPLALAVTGATACAFDQPDDIEPTETARHDDLVDSLGFNPVDAGWRFAGHQRVVEYADSLLPTDDQLAAEAARRAALGDREPTRRTYTLVVEDGRVFEKDVPVDADADLVDSLPGSGAGGEVPYDIHGTDDRWIVTNEATLSSYPYRSIGSQLGSSNSLSGTCTGGLVGPRHVLTAGHCVYSTGLNSWLWGRWWSPGHKGRGDDRFVNGTPRQVVGLLSVSDWFDNEMTVADYGMQILADQSQTASLGWFGLCPYSAADLDGDTVRLYGYPTAGNDCSGAGSPHDDGLCDGFMYGDTCPVESVSDRQVHYDCDSQGGQSGSPVWLYHSGDPCIVGVHAYASGTATRMTSSRVSLIRDWICDNPSAFATHGSCD